MKKMNEESNQGMGDSSPLQDELIKALIEEMKAVKNTLVGYGTELKSLKEKIQAAPAEHPAVKDLAKRVAELENNIAEACRSLEVITKNFEEACKALLAATKKVEKIETGFEVAIPMIRADFDNFFKKMRADFETFVRYNSISPNMQLLRDDMENFIQFFQEPRHKDVRYRHIVGKSVWVVSGLVLLLATAAAFLVLAWSRGNEHAESDFKWRWAKMSADPSQLQALDKMDRDYLSNPDEFRKNVIMEEERKKELYEKQAQVDRAKNEIKQLEQHKKTR